MISKEQFEKIQTEHGCGYWNVCDDRGCPCAIITEDKGFKESTYKSFLEDIHNHDEDLEDFYVDGLSQCIKCGEIFRESELIDDVCFECDDEEEWDW